MPHTAGASTTFPSHTTEYHTAARAEPKLPVPGAEGIAPTMAKSLGQTWECLQGTAPDSCLSACPPQDQLPPSDCWSVVSMTTVLSEEGRMPTASYTTERQYK